MPYAKKHLSKFAVSAATFAILVVIAVRFFAPESKAVSNEQYLELKRVDATDQLAPRTFGVASRDRTETKRDFALDWVQDASNDRVVSDLLRAQQDVGRQVSVENHWGPNDFVPQSYRSTSAEDASPRMDVDWDESAIEPLPQLDVVPVEESRVTNPPARSGQGVSRTEPSVLATQAVAIASATYTVADKNWQTSAATIENAKASIRSALDQVADPVLVVNLPTFSSEPPGDSSTETRAQAASAELIDVRGTDENDRSEPDRNEAVQPASQNRGSELENPASGHRAAWQSNPYFQQSTNGPTAVSESGPSDSAPERSAIDVDEGPERLRGRQGGEWADGQADLLSTKMADAPAIRKTAALDSSFSEYLLDPELPTAGGNKTAESIEPKTVARNSNTPTGGNSTKNSAPKEPVAPVGGTPSAVLKAGQFLLAEQPKMGAHFKDDTPVTDRRAFQIPATADDFSPDPVDSSMPYDSFSQMDVYEGKSLNATRRPLIEIGRPWYQLGQLPEGSTIFGKHNPVTPQFIIFGDMRTAYASNDFGDDTESVIASELNLNWNLQLTGTERFHMFISPLDNGVKNHRYLLDEDRLDSELDFDVDFGYFEGDLGAMVGGAIGQTLPFDLPFAVGVMPLLVQNGVWMEDAFLGAAATIPARNSALLDISNMDITFFAGFDEIISPAFEGEDDVAKMWGVLSFIEANNGYWEIDYAFLEDRNSARDRSYHNIGIAFTRRYGRFLSNSVRVIANAGQSTAGGPNTADGVLLLIENSLITGAPSTVVPYFNMFAGFDRPQSAARAGVAGGVLRNTGILFEPDGMTNYPTLDATANDTFGAAFGLNLLPNDFSQQFIVETAMLGVMGDRANRNAAGDQYGVGFRYQLPLNNSTILRADGMFGALRGASDIHGIRMEVRQKF